MKAKNQSTLKSFLILTVLSVLVNCGTELKNEKKNKTLNNLAILAEAKPARSESNFREANALNTRSLLGPDQIIPASTLSQDSSSELLGNINANIKNGDSNVEVNLPLEVTLLNGLSANNTGINNSYFLTLEGSVLYSRVVIDGNKITLIPQIRLQPNRKYMAIVGGIQNAKGESLGNLKINFKSRDLDYGLYWYGKFGVCEKYFPNLKNAFYNPVSATVIFSHGLQTNSVSNDDPYGRKGFSFQMYYYLEDNFGGAKDLNGLRKFTNHNWIDKGWNTGIVFWNQFADDALHAAEAKIWNLVDGPNGSSYKTMDEVGTVYSNIWDRNLQFKGQTVQVQSVGELLSLYVIDALKQNTSGNIRMTGHSLGNQMITNISGRVNASGIKINRIALLDPAWTDGTKSYLPKVTDKDMQVVLNHNGAKALDLGIVGRNFYVTEYARVILFRILNDQWKNGIVIERYNSTILDLYLQPFMNPNQPLNQQIAVMDMKPWYYSATQLKEKHNSVRQHYFWSMESSSPIECVIQFFNRIKTGDIALSASTSDSKVREMMLGGKYWSQVEGRYTADPSDDWYEVKQK